MSNLERKTKMKTVCDGDWNGISIECIFMRNVYMKNDNASSCN